MTAIATAVKHKTVTEYLPQVKTMVRLLSLRDKCPLVGLVGWSFLIDFIFSMLFFLSSINCTKDTDARSKSDYSWMISKGAKGATKFIMLGVVDKDGVSS